MITIYHARIIYLNSFFSIISEQYIVCDLCGLRSLSFQSTSLCVYHSLQWRHNGRDGVSGHQPHDCLLNRLFKQTSKKTLKLRVTGLCVGNSPVTDEFPA